MSASNNFITRPVLTTVCSILIVIVGLIAIPILPIENLPDIAPPTVKVRANYTGADAVSVEEGVTSVLEQQINGVENMDFITSNSSADGVSAIDAFMVHRAVQTAQFVPSVRGWHAHASEQAVTQDHSFVSQPFGARKVTLAQLRVVNTPAMSERHPLTGRCVENVDVVKFVLLNGLHVLLVL